MREIRFRGKCTPEFPHPTVKWVYGSLVSDSKKKKKTALICAHLPVPTRDGNTFWYEVYADTVGQYTGLRDADGREIYEGDIIDVDGFIAEVVYSGGSYELYTKKEPLGSLSDIAYEYSLSIFEDGVKKTFSVIGNIHDNPDLLEKQP